MAYTNNPQNVPRDAVRLEVGDVDQDFPILQDSDYDYFLSKNQNSIRKAALDAAKSILFALSRNTHERIDQLEIWGDQWARNYMDSLKLYVNNPNFSVSLFGAKPFAGGVFTTDIKKNLGDSSVQVVRIDRSLATESDYPMFGQVPNAFSNENNNSISDNFVVEKIRNVRTVTQNYMITDDDDIVIVTATATIILPTTSGKTFTIKRSGSGDVTIISLNSTIENMHQIVLNVDGYSVDVHYDSVNNNWVVV